MITNQSYVVDVYTASYCGWCTKTKELLKNDGIIFNEKPLEDGAFFQGNDYKDKLTANQYEKLQSFSESMKDVYVSLINGDINVDLVHTFDNLLKKSDEEFFSIIKNAEVSDDYKTINELSNYLSNNQSLVGIYNSFYNFKSEVIKNQHDFFTHVNHGDITPTIPQIFINGEIFPISQSFITDRELGAFGELLNCNEHYGDSNSCFSEFTNNHEQFIEQAFPDLKTLSTLSDLSSMESFLGIV